MRIASIVLAASISAATAASADEPWQGIWSADPGWCAQADRIGSVTPAPISISSSEVIGYENSCRIQGAEKVGSMPAWKLTLGCEAEGTRYREEVLVLNSGPDVLWYFTGTEPVRFTRCGD